MKAALRLRFIRPVDGANYYTGDLRASRLDCSFTFGTPAPVLSALSAENVSGLLSPVAPVLSALAEEMAQDRALGDHLAEAESNHLAEAESNHLEY